MWMRILNTNQHKSCHQNEDNNSPDDNNTTLSITTEYNEMNKVRHKKDDEEVSRCSSDEIEWNM